MKTKWIIVVLVCAAVITLIFVGFVHLMKSGWESSLKGPYPGTPYTEQIETPPTSTLAINGIGHLEVHETENATYPIITFRDTSNNVRWSHSLLATQRFRDGNTETAKIANVELLNIWGKRDGYQIQFSCEWNWGGIENGLIYLDNDLEFHRFGISW